MADPEPVAAVVRFALNDLGARTAHHDFEHICRHIGRARIATNVLPATGPVSAGGEQGRDAATYRTHLPEDDLAARRRWRRAARQQVGHVVSGRSLALS